MQVDDKLITYLEDLSNLALSENEKPRLTSDLTEIIECMARLNELDTTNVPERSHPFDNVNAFREDTITPSLNRDLILKNAPDRNDEFIVAPKAVE